MEKIKVLIHTDFTLAFTGFGKFIKGLLKYLHATGKYEVVHYCMNMQQNNIDLKRTPWKSIGCLPDNQQELNNILAQFRPEERDPKFREMCYGSYFLDKVISEEKPDIYFGIQDIWGVQFAVGRKWFKDLTSVIWTTLDSLPLLPVAVENAPLIKNYWMWSDFATKEMHRLGHKHVQTMHGCFETRHFFRLPDEHRKKLRQFHQIPESAFIIGFVFRNQLRKSVPNLLEGYQLFKKQNPNVNSRLLLHTFFGEGWNIHKLADEYGVSKDEILTTYICRACKNYEVKPFTGHDLNCRFCGAEKSQITTNVGEGISEEQLNHVYNLMDVYCHPFTSGGQELPIQEAKLTELITLVTNYSCGEESCYPEAKSLPLEWTEYREHGTEFRKASTTPASIAKQLTHVLKMSKKDVNAWGVQARKWTLQNFSVEAIGRKVEQFIDAVPRIKNQNVFDLSKNPKAIVPYIADNKEWVKTLYSEILKTQVLDSDSGLNYWLNELNVNKKPREPIEGYFRQVAEQENLKTKGFDLETWLDPEDKGKRVLLTIPESIGDVFLCTSLFESIKEAYPEYSLYVATKQEHFPILDCNPYIKKCLPYIPQMDSQVWLEGMWESKGFFEVAYLPFIGTQRFLDYLWNGNSRIQYDIRTRHIKWTSSDPVERKT